jgi:hypothetical protein
MHEAWTHQLETWHEFYILVGTADCADWPSFVVISLGPRVTAEPSRHERARVRYHPTPSFSLQPLVSSLFLVPGLSAPVIGVLLRRRQRFAWRYLAYTRGARHQRSEAASTILSRFLRLVGSSRCCVARLPAYSVCRRLAF